MAAAPADALEKTVHQCQGDRQRSRCAADRECEGNRRLGLLEETS